MFCWRKMMRRVGTFTMRGTDTTMTGIHLKNHFALYHRVKIKTVLVCKVQWVCTWFVDSWFLNRALPSIMTQILLFPQCSRFLLRALMLQYNILEASSFSCCQASVSWMQYRNALCMQENQDVLWWGTSSLDFDASNTARSFLQRSSSRSASDRNWQASDSALYISYNQMFPDILMMCHLASGSVALHMRSLILLMKLDKAFRRIVPKSWHRGTIRHSPHFWSVVQVQLHHRRNHQVQSRGPKQSTCTLWPTLVGIRCQWLARLVGIVGY